MSKGIHSSKYMLNKINITLKRNSRNAMKKGFQKGLIEGIEIERERILHLKFFKLLKLLFLNLKNKKNKIPQSCQGPLLDSNKE